MIATLSRKSVRTLWGVSLWGSLPIHDGRESSLGFDYENEDETCPSVPVATLNDGQLDAALDDARADGVAGEAGGVVDVEFLHEMLAMFFDGLGADAEFRRSFLVGLAFGDQLQHFQLARSQLGSFLVEHSHAVGRWRMETIETPGN